VLSGRIEEGGEYCFYRGESWKVNLKREGRKLLESMGVWRRNEQRLFMKKEMDMIYHPYQLT